MIARPVLELADFITAREGVYASQFDQMHERGVKPNVYIYNAMIKAQASTGDLVEVKLLISRPAEQSCSDIWLASNLDQLLLAFS